MRFRIIGAIRKIFVNRCLSQQPASSYILGVLLLCSMSNSYASEIYKSYKFPGFEDTDKYQAILAEVPEMLEAKLEFTKKGNNLEARLVFNEARENYLAVSLIIVLFDKAGKVLSAARYPFIFTKCADLIFSDGKTYNVRFEFGQVEEVVDHYLLSYRAIPDQLRGTSCVSK